MAHPVKRITKIAILGVSLTSAAILLRKNDWEVSTIGMMRFGRAAWAVST